MRVRPLPRALVWWTRPRSPQSPLLAAVLVDLHLSLGARCEGPPPPQPPFWGPFFQCRPGHYIVLEQRLFPLKWVSLPQTPSPSPFPILCGGVRSTHCQLLGGQPRVPPWVLWEPPVPILSPPSAHLSPPGLTLCCLHGVLLLESILSPSLLSRWEPFGRGVPTSTGLGFQFALGEDPGADGFASCVSIPHRHCCSLPWPLECGGLAKLLSALGESRRICCDPCDSLGGQ